MDTCYLYLNKSSSNIYVTFSDLKNKVVRCQTSGSSGLPASKRRKKNPYAVVQIMAHLLIYLKLYKITKVILVLKLKVNSMFYFLNKELVHNGIQIVKLRLKRSVAFNGVRARKLRRI